MIRNCIQYYMLYWKDRNEAIHNKTIQRERMVDQYNKVKIDIELSEYPQMKKFTVRNKIDIERSNT